MPGIGLGHESPGLVNLKPGFVLGLLDLPPQLVGDPDRVAAILERTETVALDQVGPGDPELDERRVRETLESFLRDLSRSQRGVVSQLHDVGHRAKIVVVLGQVRLRLSPRRLLLDLDEPSIGSRKDPIDSLGRLLWMAIESPL